MMKDGRYIYCIIAADCDSSFGTIGVGGREDLVYTIGFKGLAMVVSNCPLSQLEVNPDNVIAHQRVIEKVMEEYNSVLPVRFGTIATSSDEIINMLGRRGRDFSEQLNFVENKVEINVKGLWKNMELIFKEIDQNHSAIQEIKQEIFELKDQKKKEERIVDAGRLVQQALEDKKDEESQCVIQEFRNVVSDFKDNETNQDPVFMNTAFMVSKGREKEFDFLMEDLGDKYNQRIDFICTGPLPVFNFIDLEVLPESWEV